MDIASLPILRTIFPMSFAGMFIGIMVGLGRNPEDRYKIWYYIAAGAVFFGWLGWCIVTWKVKQSLRLEMRSETPAPIIQNQTIERIYVVHLEGARHRIPFFDMTPEQWQNLANMIVRSKSYTQDFFVDILKDRAKGRQVYHLVSGALNREDIFLVVYGSGYKLTDAGEELFDKLAAGDVSVLDGLEE